jgi:hypothetical protein
MGKLVGLDGVDDDRDALRLLSIEGAVQIIKAGGACVSAGDNGSVTAWRDDEGEYRCNFQRLCSVKAELKTKSLQKVRSFISEWIPEMHNK